MGSVMRNSTRMTVVRLVGLSTVCACVAGLAIAREVSHMELRETAPMQIVAKVFFFFKLDMH